MKKNIKGGRPKIEIKRKKRKEIMFSDKEYFKLNKMFIESSYKNMNEMIRDIILKERYQIITLDKELLVERDILIEEVRRIGNNFNQLMKLLHQKKLDYFTKEDINCLVNNINNIKNIYNRIEISISNNKVK